MKNGITLPFPGPSVYVPAGGGKANQGGRRGGLEVQEERRKEERFQFIDTAEGGCYFCLNHHFPAFPEEVAGGTGSNSCLPAPLPTPALC